MRDSPEPDTITGELKEFLDGQRGARRDLSGEFQDATTRPPSVRDMHALQLQTRRDLQHLCSVVRSLKRMMFLSYALFTTILICLVAGLALTADRTSWLADYMNSGQIDTNRGPSLRDARDNEFAEPMIPGPMIALNRPLSEVDREFYPLIRDLYRRAIGFQRTSHDGRVGEDYVRFQTDATLLIERATERDVTQELVLVTVRIMELARQNYRHLGEPTAETQRLSDQIGTILRDYSPRDYVLDRPSI